MLRLEKDFARTSWKRDKNILDEQTDKTDFQRRLLITAMFLTTLLLLVWGIALWQCCV